MFVYRLLLIALGTFFLPTSAFSEDTSAIWENILKPKYYPEKVISDGSSLFDLVIPSRAEDPAAVPVQLVVKPRESSEKQIDNITILIDNNPEPFAVRFRLGHSSEIDKLAFRLRINTYTYVRAIAETVDGRLWMQKAFVKASGGCSAPIQIKTNNIPIGKIKNRLLMQDGQLKHYLMIAHPNITGLQLDQVSKGYPPAHFINSIDISTTLEQILHVESDISLSTNPTIGYTFSRNNQDKIVITVTDNMGNVYESSVE